MPTIATDVAAIVMIVSKILRVSSLSHRGDHDHRDNRTCIRVPTIRGKLHQHKAPANGMAHVNRQNCVRVKGKSLPDYMDILSGSFCLLWMLN